MPRRLKVFRKAFAKGQKGQGSTWDLTAKLACFVLYFLEAVELC